MRLGILGGTFNPPHIGHLIVAENVREQLTLDKIIFIPSFTPPHKVEIADATPQQRFEMVELAIKNNKNFLAYDIEIGRKGKSYTIDTINALVLLHPQARFYFIIGMDNLTEFATWKSPQEIISKVDLVVVNRPGYEKPVKNEFSRYAIFLRVPNIDISSSDIRKRVKFQRTIRYLVHPDVEKYITQKGLYKL